ncbi:hypothetical protein GCM10010151_15370 [Actinoallomurus spadix]|uniref:Putative restriction endonuclease domain-containing protein n=1 Tax=Actinoallomurus spadix TaxID=79912 RepID=A0ABN0W6M3_9ACTN
MTEAFAMPPDHHRTSWTIEEVLALPENGMRQELFEGRLVESPVPPPSHQNAGQRLIRLLYPAVPPDYEVTPETNIRIGPDLFIPGLQASRDRLRRDGRRARGGDAEAGRAVRAELRPGRARRAAPLRVR